MHLTRLRYFVVTADEQSVVRAAKRLRIAQPALSRQLAALEKEVGAPLFERHPRGIRLLPAGEAFLVHARRAIAEAESAVAAARRAVAPPTCPRLRIAVPDWPSRAHWVARAVEQLRASRPDVAIAHDPLPWLENEAGVAEGVIDIGFAVGLGPGDFSSELEPVRLCDEPACIAILPAAHPLAQRPSIELADLRDVTLLVPPRDRSPRAHDVTIATVRSGGYEPRVATGSTSFAVAIQMVVAGAGWIIAPHSGVEGLPAEARGVPIADASIVLGFYLLRRRTEHAAVIDDFVRCLRSVISEMSEKAQRV